MNIKVHQIGCLVALIGLGVGNLLLAQSAFADTYRRPQVIQRRPRVIRQQPRVVLKKPRVILKKPRVIQRRPRVIRQQPRVVLKKPRVILNKKSQVINKKSQVINKKPRITLNNKSRVVLNKRSQVIQRRPQVVLKKSTNYYPHNIYQQPTNYHPYVIYQQPIYQQPSVIYQRPSYRQPDVIYQRSTKQIDTSEEQLEISIRYAHPEDVERIHRVLFTSVRTLCANDYTPEQIEAWVGNLDLETSRNNVGKDGKVLLVAEDNEGVIVGFASLNKGEINAVYVHPYYSWQEVSTLLLDAVKAEAVAQNVEKLVVSASTTAVPFYQTRGYRVVKQSSHNLGSGVQIPCVHMEQALLQSENP